MRTPTLISPTRLRAILLATSLGIAAGQARGQGHWFAGAASTNQGSQLIFNAANFVASSGYAYWLTPSNSGTYAGLYNSGNPTWTALAQTTNNGATPSPFAAAPGSFLRLKLVSLAGPSNGNYFFFDEGAVSPTFAMAVGSTPSNYVLNLSDPSIGAGAPGADPYGHIHGRRHAVDKPGTYTLGIQVLDSSTNGPGGGPIHTNSGLYLLNYQAGESISSVTPGSNGVDVKFPTRAGSSYYVQASTNVADTNGWMVVSTNSGNNYFRTQTHTNPVSGPGYYRLKITTP